MTAWLLALMLWQQGGTITGVLRDAEGKPFPGARVAAVAQRGTPEAAREATAMSALAETDAEGRYRLENVPPGKYYIAAGSVSLPTFYPGTQNLDNGTVVTVAAGVNIAGIDFRLQNSSVRGPDAFDRAATPPTLQIPIEIEVEGGGPVPVFGPTGSPKIEVSGIFVTFGSDSLFLSGPAVDAGVAVSNLPPGYSLKSLSFDNTDLKANNLKLSGGQFSALALSRNNSIAAAVTAALNAAIGGATPTSVTPQAPIRVPSLLIVLTRNIPPTAGRGVRVSGIATGAVVRQVYASGVPGTLYLDGSFEFRGVPSGRHSIVMVDANGRQPFAASVIVGDTDIEGVRLEPVSVLPPGIAVPAAPAPPGKHAPGSTIPLAALRGTIVDKETKEPISAGTAFLSGQRDVSLDALDNAGRFEFPKLLPGTYLLEIRLVHHVAEAQTITIGDDDVNLEISAVRPKDQ